MPWRPRVPALAIVALAVFTLWINWCAKSLELRAREQQSKPVIIGEQAPNFQLAALSGHIVSLSDYRGKKVVITFWASWCGPCRIEMPVLRKFYQRMHEDESRFEFLAISVDTDREAADAAATDDQLPFPVLIDSSGTTAAAYQVQAIPTLLVIDENGKVKGGQTGFQSASDIFLATELGIKTILLSLERKPMPPVIEFQNVTKVFSRRLSKKRVSALSAVSFQVEPGEVCAFLGPNGAGKTTSISIIMGFLFPDTGEISVFGFPPGDVRAKEKIGFLPENFAFYKHLTAPRLLRLHLALSGHRLAGDAWIDELLTRVKLNGYEHLRIGKYSRGMVQRLGIAQALLADPQLLILDEPTSGLDPAGRKEILSLLSLLKASGKTVFVSSHILPEVEQICDRVVVIDRGQLIRAGRLQDLLGPGTRVEIVVDQLSELTEREVISRGAAVSRDQEAVHLVLDAMQKRAIEDLLRNAGAEIISLRQVRSSLEDVFLKLVEDHDKQ